VAAAISSVMNVFRAEVALAAGGQLPLALAPERRVQHNPRRGQQ
jgi:hypothetical protein